MAFVRSTQGNGSVLEAEGGSSSPVPRVPSSFARSTATRSLEECCSGSLCQHAWATNASVDKTAEATINRPTAPAHLLSVRQSLMEDLVIDGETEIDDLVVAAHVAQADSRHQQQLESVCAFGTKRAAARVRRAIDEGTDSSDDEDVLTHPGGLSESNDFAASLPVTKIDVTTGYVNQAEKQYVTEQRRIDGWRKKKSESDDFGDAEDEEQSENVTNGDGAIALRALIQPIVVNDLPEVVPDGCEIVRCGEVHTLIDGLLCLKATEDSNPLDLGSVVCLFNRKVIGVIADTFGPTTAAFYVVYVSLELVQNEEIKLEQGMPVFCDVEHSSFLLGDNGEIPEYLRRPWSSTCTDRCEHGSDDDGECDRNTNRGGNSENGVAPRSSKSVVSRKSNIRTSSNIAVTADDWRNREICVSDCDRTRPAEGFVGKCQTSSVKYSVDSETFAMGGSAYQQYSARDTSVPVPCVEHAHGEALPRFEEYRTARNLESPTVPPPPTHDNVVFPRR